MVRGDRRRAEQLDVIDLGAVRPDRRARSPPAECASVTSVSRSTLPTRDSSRVLIHEEEPVAAPGDVAGDAAQTSTSTDTSGALPIARHVRAR